MTLDPDVQSVICALTSVIWISYPVEKAKGSAKKYSELQYRYFLTEEAMARLIQSSKKNNWLIIGRLKNWETALLQPVPLWGLKPVFNLAFTALNVGDIVWFYVTDPVKGVIGLGLVKDKYIDTNNLVWPEEQVKKAVIWPLRFRIQVLKVLNSDQWTAGRIKINDFRLNWQVGFQALRDDHMVLLTDRAMKAFGVTLNADFSTGATIAQATAVSEAHREPVWNEAPVLTHRSLQESIAEIGKLQYYHSQLEYPIDLPGENKNIDVIWKREIAGVPTYAFEVELSGGIERAITRLKFAYTRWNSQPRMIVPKELVGKINNIIATEDRMFSERFKMYEPAQIVDLLRKKRDLKSFEQNLGIY
jgi:hypothetical protein